MAFVWKELFTRFSVHAFRKRFKTCVCGSFGPFGFEGEV